MPVARRVSSIVRLARTAALLVAIVFVPVVTGCMEWQFYQPEAGPTPLPAGFAGAEAVAFASADGTRLHGWFLPAQTPESGSPGGDARAPTVLHVHGNAGNITSHLGFSERLPGAGFNVFIFDYRGYGESEGTARKRDDLIADTAAALDALLARPDVDPARIGMLAVSLGGGIGLSVMADRPEIAAAVVESTFASWREVAADAVAAGDRPGPVARFLAGLFIRDHRRPDEAIARIDRPILIVHGDADRIVPVHHGRALAAAAPNAELVVIPGGGHNTLRDDDPTVDRRIAGFFRRHLPDRRP